MAFLQKIHWFCYTRSESSLNLPHFRYHSIVVPCCPAATAVSGAAMAVNMDGRDFAAADGTHASGASGTGAVASSRAALERPDFAVRRLPLIFTWK